MNKYSGRFAYYVGRKMVRLITEVMLHLDIVKKSPMPKGAKILVVNHPTTSDPFIITTICREHSIILIKDILFKIPIFGTYLKWSGHIPVVEGEGIKAFERAKKFLERGKTIILFIEGEITPHDGVMIKPKTGAVRLSLSCRVPIIPVGVGVKKENIKLIYSRIKGNKELGTWYFWGPYAITQGKPIQLLGKVADRRKVRELSNMIMKKVIALSNESADRIGSVGSGIGDFSRI
jgi:1-acyl-sn-glycerol-3-phosphate acyltransferase